MEVRKSIFIIVQINIGVFFERFFYLKPLSNGAKCWHYSNFLKLVSAIFYKMFIFSPNDSLSKTEKCFSFHLKNSFRSRDIQFLVIFFPSFPHFPDSKGKMETE